MRAIVALSALALIATAARAQDSRPKGISASATRFQRAVSWQACLAMPGSQAHYPSKNAGGIQDSSPQTSAY